MKRIFAVLFLIAAPLLCSAQTSDNPPNATPDSQQQPRNGRGMRQHQGVAGTIGEMKSDGFTLKLCREIRST